jgi:hypothetical protein
VVNQNHQTLPTSTDFLSLISEAHHNLHAFSIVYGLQSMAAQTYSQFSTNYHEAPHYPSDQCCD